MEEISTKTPPAETSQRKNAFPDEFARVLTAIYEGTSVSNVSVTSGEGITVTGGSDCEVNFTSASGLVFSEGR